MKNCLITAIIGLILGGVGAVYTYSAAPETYDREPELCLAGTMTEGSVFTDYGTKTLLVIKTNGEVDIYEEARDDRGNCIE